jgi:hypothetical protein
MPFIAGLLPLITAIGSLAGAGVGIGEAVSNSNNQSDQQAANQKALLQQQQSQANQQSLQRQQAIRATQGQAQAQTGGSLTEPGFQDFAAQLAGLPGYSAAPTPGQIGGSQQTGAALPTAGGLAPGGQVDMRGILAALGQQQGGFGGNISGGGSAPTAPPSQFFELSSPVV